MKTNFANEFSSLLNEIRSCIPQKIYIKRSNLQQSLFILVWSFDLNVNNDQ